ncbi:MAG: acetolactate synthase [Phycisphaerae bacterium]|nr:acetolactate synthase [Phycisphaerae bacterium]
MSTRPFETAERPSGGSVRQLSVFLENRVGQLLRLFQVFHGTPVRVLGINIVQATDCAILRLICDEVDEAKRLLKAADFAVNESELVVVELPSVDALPTVCAALLAAELSISYIYPLLVHPSDHFPIAIHCEDVVTAATVLSAKRFRLLSDEDLGRGQIR